MTDVQETQEHEISKNNSNTDKNKKKSKFAVKEEITEENCKFSDGQLLKFVKVRFPGHAKSYSFLIGDRNLTYGKKVMAMSDRGMAVGYINSFPYELPFKKDLLPLRSITKAATPEDIAKETDTYKKQKEIETTCQSLIDKHNLDMNLTHVEFTQFGKKVVFYFVAPARVDFRGLVKDLVSELRLRIELRQISVRDRAASQGAIGPCGRELCCSSFLSKYGNVSVKMAKNQNLTLNYSKLNGVCGQLKCCLQYEDEVYSYKRKKMPTEGQFVQTKNGDTGKVTKLNILSQQFDMLTDQGKIRRFTYDQVTKIYKEGEYKFPRHFDNISDDTATVQGLSDREARLTRQFERDMEKMQKKAKRNAHEVIEGISDFLPERDRTQDLNESDLIDSPKRKEDEFVLPKPSENNDKNNSTPVNSEENSADKTSYNKNRRNNNYRKNNNRNRPNNRNRKNFTNKKTNQTKAPSKPKE